MKNDCIYADERGRVTAYFCANNANLCVLAYVLQIITTILASLEVGLDLGWPGKWREMQRRDKLMLRRRLDVEMRPFRRLGNDDSATNGLLRALRQALEIPVGKSRRSWGW